MRGKDIFYGGPALCRHLLDMVHAFTADLLLKGIVKHGYGQWQVMAADTELCLGCALQLGTNTSAVLQTHCDKSMSVLPRDDEDGVDQQGSISAATGNVAERSAEMGPSQARERFAEESMAIHARVAAQLQSRADYLAAALLLENADSSSQATAAAADWHHQAVARAHAHAHAHASAMSAGLPGLTPHMLRPPPVPGEPVELHEQRLSIVTQFNALLQQLESAKYLARIMKKKQV